MIKKTFVMENFEGVTVIEEFRFHLSKIELSEKEILSEGLYRKRLEAISETSKASEVYPLLKEFILDSVGRVSEDGTYFEKTPEIQRKFMQCGAYEMLVFEILQDSKAASEFMNGLMPADLVAEAQKIIDAQVKPTNKTEQTTAGNEIIQRFKPLEEYTRPQLLHMPQEQFETLVGTNPQKMTPEHLTIAYMRKIAGE